MIKILREDLWAYADGYGYGLVLWEKGWNVDAYLTLVVLHFSMEFDGGE